MFDLRISPLETTIDACVDEVDFFDAFGKNIYALIKRD